jgi:pimeloyl-ACP methyl ester carboxylesterase
VATAVDADFYEPPTPLGDGEPGDVIRTEEIYSPISDMRLWTVLYRSVGLDGEPIAVSGVIATPEETGDGPHQYLSWAHGTTGLADSTAPSRRGAASLLVDLLYGWTQDGFVVAATDYEGLGTPGLHPYFVGESEGRAVLDAARATRSFIGPDEDDTVVLAGHSQGGHAALFAAQLAPTYAADLPVLGTVAIAPAGDLASLVSSSIGETADEDHRYAALLVITAWRETLGLRTDQILTPAGAELAAELIEDNTVAFPGDDPLFLADPITLPEWRDALEANTPGAPASPDSIAPILILQGTADTIITVDSSQLVADRYCDVGAIAELRILEGDDHISVVRDHLAEISDWISQRLAGSPSEGCPP